MLNWKIAATAVLLTGLLLSALIEPAPPTIYANAQKQSVTVRTESASGSAVIFQRNNSYGNSSRYFAWTANHVIEKAQSTQIQTYFRYEGALAGTAFFDADILSVSTNYDLALLWVHAPPGTFGSAVFAGNWSVAPGDEVFACGTFMGRLDGSISVGVVSQVGIRSPAKWWAVVDQITAPIFPGSSGGPLYNSDGECIGLTVGGFGPVLGLFVPVRSMRVWSSQEGLQWSLAGSVCPEDAVLEELAHKYALSLVTVVGIETSDGLRSRLAP